MLSVADIIKLLERIPKALVSLPKRIAGLGPRVKPLDAPANDRSELDPRDCPQCGARMRIESERDDDLLGLFGMKQHAMRCDECGTTATRQYDPARGYRE